MMKMADHTPPGEMQDKYRAVFLQSPMGLEVLGDILQECHFGCTLDPDNKVEVSEHGVGVLILAKCGVFSPGTLGDVVRALASVTPMPINKEEEE